MIARRPSRVPADWPRRRKAALIAFALIMAYLHSFYLLGFYVSEDEYWWPVWTGMTAEQRLLSFALALFANFGLMAMPFLRAPGRVLRALVTLSLSFGLAISVAWLGHDIYALGLPDIGVNQSIENITLFPIDIFFLVLGIILRIFYAAAICLNLWFLVNLLRTFLAVRN